MRDFSNERLTLTLAPGDEDWVFATADNAWIGTTERTVEVTADEHEAIARLMVKRWNAVIDALAELNKGPSHATYIGSAVRARQILHAAMEP